MHTHRTENNRTVPLITRTSHAPRHLPHSSARRHCSALAALTLTVELAVTMHECWYPADTVEVSRASARDGTTAAATSAASARGSRREAFDCMALLLTLIPKPASDFPPRRSPAHICREQRCGRRRPLCSTMMIHQNVERASRQHPTLALRFQVLILSPRVSRRKKNGQEAASIAAPASTL